MKLEKLEWMKRVTAKQVAVMCVIMVVIYFIAPLAGHVTLDEVNQVGSMGTSYEEDVLETHVVYVMHESGYLAKTDVPIAQEKSLVESVFSSIQRGSPRLQHHVDGLIPPGAVLRDYTLDHGRLTLNLSESFLYYRASEEEDLLTSLVWSMTALPDVERVYFQLEGEKVNNFNGAMDVGRGLTRAMGINLEVDAINVANAQMLKLYFFTDDTEDALLVPVTRLVSDTVDPFEYAVSSLVRGPIGATYISVFNHRATLLDAPQLENGIMTLNFSSDLFFDQGQTQVSSQVIKQLVMTLTEFDEVSEVSVVIEGSSRIFDDAGNPITVPVGRNVMLGQEGRVGGFVRGY
ncbi:MAG: GerMN domain-containing protein [Defluviitaleaceae bacterium]|nr:GerMN domain-containing protein [Defluviitaleaceae bacterium]